MSVGAVDDDDGQMESQKRQRRVAQRCRNLSAEFQAARSEGRGRTAGRSRGEAVEAGTGAGDGNDLRVAQVNTL